MQTDAETGQQKVQLTEILQIEHFCSMQFSLHLKGEVVPVLNSSKLCHEDIWGGGKV
jgi:hypothetical protein